MNSALTAGTKLGRYEIRSQLGAGGMGEVYRARDEKLNRDVAIKVLPPAFSQDGQRLLRFEQEAQAAGALNHPNILSIFDVATHDGVVYVVSELLEGEALRDVLDRSQLSKRKAVDYATQIAHGLAAAHEKGIVHRDLKPDNLFVTNDDRVKILDFGLAKLVQPSGDEVAQTDIATRKVHTDPGTVMGTVGYMSPEQVRGRSVDHRSDIFSFGAVFYEMLSGKRAFHGESAIETLNSILKEEPQELTNTDPNIPPALERVVWHCLEKNPDRRFQSATDVAFALESLTGASTRTSGQTMIEQRPASLVTSWSRERLIWAGICALLLLALSTLAYFYFSRPKTTAPVVKLALAVPEATQPLRVTISPDGMSVVFIATNTEGRRLLWVRPLNSLVARQIEGTEGAVSPFWSPDSRFIGFFANRKLLKVEASGGRPQTICDVVEDRGGAWNSEGTILFAGPEGLYRVSAQSGAPTLATKLGPREEAHRWPYFLPDGRHFVFLADAETAEDHHIRIGSLDSQDTDILFSAISRIEYATPGYLVYVNQGALVARGFDAGRLKLTSDAITVAEHVVEVGPNHEFDFSISQSGALAYQSGNPNSQLTWFDRVGKKLGSVGEPANFAAVRLSPDGHRAATVLLDADGRVADIWMVDVSRQSISRFTFEPSGEGDPLWSPDGSQIVFSSSRAGSGATDLYQKSAGGAGEDQLLFSSASAKFPTSWSRDGELILFENWAVKEKGAIWVLSVRNKQAKPLLQAREYNHFQGQLSPDGRYVAYVSNESGSAEVYVQPFSSTGEKWRISSGGGVLPIWRDDGRELFYLTDEGSVMSAEITLSQKFESGIPRKLFQTKIKYSGDGLCYDATPDGQRFLINTFVENNNPAPMTIVLNWAQGLNK